MLVSSVIPNLINGVSQQPYALRLSSQAEIQDNGHATVAEGLKKRPPSLHIAKLFDTSMPDAFIHLINRDMTERYVVTIVSGDLKVHSVDGTERSVNFPHGKAYLDSISPVSTFRAITVADYTFILNNTIAVQKGSKTSPSRPFEALVYIKQGNYGKTYAITLPGLGSASYTTPDGSNAAHSPYIDTTHIASQLSSQLQGNTHFSCTQYGSVLHLVSYTTNFGISVVDGFNGNATELIKRNVQRFSELPSNAPDGYVVEVAGDGSTIADNYFVKFVKKDASDSTGVWKETTDEGILLDIAPSTMPHVLVREADGTFTFKRAEWDERLVGNDDSAPYPSFVGRKITDLFFYRNRLGFLCEENVIFSEAGAFFNFFPTTVTAVLDSSPIDVAVSHTKVSTLRHAVPFNEELLLFAQQTQFVLKSGDLLTPKSVEINQTTEFECAPFVRPVGAGRNVYFPVSKGAYTGVREYFVDSEAGTNDAADITAHIAKYILGTPLKMAAAPNEDTLVLLSNKQRNVLYVYKYYWSGEDKLQSSWSRWVFTEDTSILSFDFMETKLFVVASRPDGTYLEVVNLDLGADDGINSPYRLMLDRKTVINTGELETVEGLPHTKLTLPYKITKGDYVAFVLDGVTAGQVHPVIERDNAYYIAGDHRLSSVCVGVRYKFHYRFSTLMVREGQQGGGSQALVTGRLQLRRFSVSYDSSGHFIATVTPKGRNPYHYKFTNKIVGDTGSVIGSVELGEGVFRFPLHGRNLDVTIDIANETPFPNTLLNATWEGFYVNHSQRM